MGGYFGKDNCQLGVRPTQDQEKFPALANCESLKFSVIEKIIRGIDFKTLLVTDKYPR